MTSERMPPRVVVTGVGVVSPIGIGRETFWQNLVAGHTGIRPLTAFSAAGLPSRLAAQILDFDPEQHIYHKKFIKVMARDIQGHASVRVVNPDHLLFTLQDDREVAMDLYVNKGRGYVESEMHPVDRSLPVDVVRIDAIYNPVRRANFTVTETRVGQRTDYDRLAVMVETNGTITPEDAIAYAAALCQEHFRYFVEFGKVPSARPAPTEAGVVSGSLRVQLGRLIDDFGLSVRSLNSLKNSNIRTLRDLVEFSEDDLLKVKNVGEKALAEIADLLQREGLNFGMVFEETPTELRIVHPGTPPMAPSGGSTEG